MWCSRCRHPCRRYTYPGAYAPHPAFQDFDTGGVIRIRHQRFSLFILGLIRYFTLFHGKHLRILSDMSITCSALIALTKTCDCALLSGWQAARDAHHQAQRQNIYQVETPPPAFTGEELSLRQRKEHINSLSCPRDKVSSTGDRRRECVSPLCAGRARCRLAAIAFKITFQHLSIFCLFLPARWKEKVRENSGRNCLQVSANRPRYRRYTPRARC